MYLTIYVKMFQYPVTEDVNTALWNMITDKSDATYLFCRPEGCLCLFIHFPNIGVLDWKDDKSARTLS